MGIRLHSLTSEDKLVFAIVIGDRPDTSLESYTLNKRKPFKLTTLGTRFVTLFQSPIISCKKTSAVLITLTCSPKTELRRTQLHEIRPKAYHGASSIAPHNKM